MKKTGFTLAEALIALGIVGVVAALMLPMANKFKPDQYKVSYIKTYDSLVEAVSLAASNKRIYPTINSDESREEYKNIVYSDYPLYNTIGVENVFHGVNLTEGEQKFCEVLAYSFGADENDIKCSVNDLSGTNYSFKSKTGADFIVKTTIKAPNSDKGDFKAEVIYDADGLKKGKNSLYSADIKNPDQFKFVVYADGRVTPDDEKGRSYLTTRSNWKKIEDNMANLTVKGSDSQYESFELLAYVQPVIEEVPEPEPEPEPFYGYGCLESYIVSQGTYGDPTASCAGKTIYMETIPNEPATQAEADEACKAKGMVLPYYFQLSAAGRFAEELGLEPGDYWATPGSDNKGRVCNLPTGNCGEHSRTARLQYRCVKPYN